MTEEEIARAWELLGPHKKFPHYFMDKDLAPINELLELLPKALDEIEKLHLLLKRERGEVEWIKNGNYKLRTVAEAIEKYISLCESVSQPWRMNDDLDNALKAWRGE